MYLKFTLLIVIHPAFLKAMLKWVLVHEPRYLNLPVILGPTSLEDLLVVGWKVNTGVRVDELFDCGWFYVAGYLTMHLVAARIAFY